MAVGRLATEFVARLALHQLRKGLASQRHDTCKVKCHVVADGEIETGKVWLEYVGKRPHHVLADSLEAFLQAVEL